MEEESEGTDHVNLSEMDVEVEEETLFAQTSLSLSPQLVNNLTRGGLHVPTEVQLQVIPKIRNARGKDLCVNAPTGSGKTLAYALPIVESLSRRSFTGLGCVVVVPTRELVQQVKLVFDLCLRKMRLKMEVAHGQRTLIEEQEKIVGSGPTRLGGNMLVDILIATPGRLAEHVLHTPGFTLQHLQFLVLDEADRLLHQSFQNWIELVLREISSPKVLDTPRDMLGYILETDELPIIGQSHLNKLFNRTSPVPDVRKLIFSATLTHDVGKLASLQMNYPEIISIHSQPQTLDVEETGDDAIFSLPTTLREYAVTALEDKPLVLLHLLETYHLRDKTLIFTHSTETATRLNHLLSEFYTLSKEDVTTAVISSEVPLKVRKKFLSSFTSGKLNIVITTDLLSRGMDIKGIQHIVNYDSPPTARVYIHRAGRTARAGKEGSVWSLVAQNEAHWFFKSVIPNIKRCQPLERITKPKVSEHIKSHYTTIIDI